MSEVPLYYDRAMASRLRPEVPACQCIEEYSWGSGTVVQ